jgi:hypothetical protein
MLWRDDHTETFPSTDGKRESKGFRFSGYISPEDVREWYRAGYLKAAGSKSVEA